LALCKEELVELIKVNINMPKNIIPFISLVIGIIIGIIASPFTDLGIILRIWAGGFAGLSATGLFELAFNKREGTTKNKGV
jgi:hypothetical protein